MEQQHISDGGNGAQGTTHYGSISLVRPLRVIAIAIVSSHTNRHTD